jgi:hypothetical protein
MHSPVAAEPATWNDHGNRMPISTVQTIGTFYSEEGYAAGQKCAVNVVLDWHFDGNMQGVARMRYRTMVDHPCDDQPGGTYSERAVFTGTFNGTIDRRTGTVLLAGLSTYSTTDGIWRGEMSLVAGTGTGGLAGVYGSIQGGGVFWEPHRFTGSYRIK